MTFNKTMSRSYVLSSDLLTIQDAFAQKRGPSPFSLMGVADQVALDGPGNERGDFQSRSVSMKCLHATQVERVFVAISPKSDPPSEGVI